MARRINVKTRAAGAVPDPEVVARPTRRQFTAEYRLRILEEADRCADRGEVGRLLRREGLYSSHLANWRKARREGALSGLRPKKRGRKPSEANPLMPKVKRLFSRYAVGWMVAGRENSALAQRLIEETCLKHGVKPHVLTLHSDRGAPMTSQGTAQLLARLGVNRSLGRPRVSDDNPYSEAQFKTLKYHPDFPSRFPNQDAATDYCRSFFPGTTRNTAMPASPC